MTYKKLSILLLALLVIAGCNRPQMDFSYISLSHEVNTAEKEFSFIVDMDDPDQVYNLYIGARLRHNYDKDIVRMTLRAISPSGQQYGEKVSLPADIKKIHHFLKKSNDSSIVLIKTGSFYDIQWCYRRGIHPVELGRWKLIITPHNNGLDGIGVYCRPMKKKSRRHRSHAEAFIDAQYKDSRFQ